MSRLIAKADVTYALQFTPYDATNPLGFQSAAQIAGILGAYPTTVAMTAAIAAMRATIPVVPLFATVALTGNYGDLSGRPVDLWAALTPPTVAGTIDIAPQSVHTGARGWLDTFIGAGFESTLQTVSLSTHGCAGAVFGTRSGDQAQSGAQSGYAIGTFALNNNTAYPQTVYGGYFESIRYPGAGNTLGVEIDVTNLGARVTQSPYLMIPNGITPGLWLQAFHSRVTGLSAVDPSCAIGILSIGCKWASGIVFSVGSVAGGVDNYAPPIAMDMPATYSVVWRNPVDAQPVAVVRSDCTQIAGTGAGGSIIFNNSGVDFQSANGTAQIHYSNTNVTLGRTIFAQSVALGIIHIAADDTAAAAIGVGANELYVTSAGVVRCRIS